MSTHRPAPPRGWYSRTRGRSFRERDREDPIDDSDTSSPAESLYAEFLRDADDGDSSAFADFATLHPEHRASLERLWRVDRAMRPESSSFFYRPGTVEAEDPRQLIEPEPGTTLGPYELRRKVGQGGMGQVWEAIDHQLERRVAVKLINPGRLSQRALDFFEREARAGARVRHPGIVAVFAAGEIDGVPYIAQEMVDDAISLAESFEAVRRVPSLPGDYYRQVARVFLQLADALGAAHAAGVIHRDVKPRNILVAPGDRPIVTDFGLARILTEESVSQPGEGAGTYAYMSPEQVRLSRDVDARTDVFSLGVVLYEALTLVRPFDGDTAQQVAHKILHVDPPDARQVRSRVPPDIAVICAKMLEKERDRRYPSMEELGADLGRYLRDEPILARPPGSLERAAKWARRHPTKAGIGAVGAIALVVISVLLVVASKARSALASEVVSVERLSALQELEELTSEARHLWPAHPDRIEAYRAWIGHARKLIDDLPIHRAKREELRALAIPRTAAEREADRASHPDLSRLTAMQNQLRSRDIALRRRRDGIETPLVLPDVSGDDYPNDAKALRKLAQSLVKDDDREFGQEALSLALAMRALEIVGDDGLTRARICDTIAWGYFALGRDEEALDWWRAVGETTPEDDLPEYARYLAGIEDMVAEISSEDVIARFEQGLEVLRGRIAELELRVAERREWRFADEDRMASWWNDQLTKLIIGLEALDDGAAGLLAAPDGDVSVEHGWSVPRRLAFAERLRDGFADGADWAARWEEARRSIRENPEYAGLDLRPQMGLVPIGSDPSSGFPEFWHVASGGEPGRDPDDGTLELTDDIGIVLVLLPPGVFFMGAQADEPNEPNYDPRAFPLEGPVHEVELTAFFASKYEVTQAQWRRLAGENPSAYPAGKLEFTALHPVEQVSWLDCMEWAGRAGLELPSEARWEYAARAWTDTPWWTGAGRESLRTFNAANLADRAAVREDAKWREIEDWPDLDDGFGMHAPIGSYSANRFGLHEVHGNVWEWCLDGFDEGFYGNSPAIDPVAPSAGAPTRPYRGGAFDFAAANARSSCRGELLTASASHNIGLRPVRSIDP